MKAVMGCISLSSFSQFGKAIHEGSKDSFISYAGGNSLEKQHQHVLFQDETL